MKKVDYTIDEAYTTKILITNAHPQDCNRMMVGNNCDRVEKSMEM